MPLSKKLIVTFGGFMLTSLLSACSLFDSRPKQMTIEYDEEVKLHNGEMIWVHITRHYVLTGGGALGDTGAFRRHYIPKEVEISWDTGFEGVGRKSVYFMRQITTIDKFNNQWYIYGATDRNVSGSIAQSISCNDVGTFYFKGDACLVKVNSKGQFIQPSKDEIYNLENMNILYSDSVSGDRLLSNQKLTWQKKLKMQDGKSEQDKTINIKIFSEEGK